MTSDLREAIKKHDSLNLTAWQMATETFDSLNLSYVTAWPDL